MSNKRIILIPGFGEDEHCFRNITQYLAPHPYKIINYRTTVDRYSIFNFSLKTFVSQLIVDNDIRPDDLLIGHSLGGFIAYNLRQVLGCEACLIGAFTSPNKVRYPVSSKWIMNAYVLLGGLKLSIGKKIAMRRRVGMPSLAEASAVYDNFATFKNKTLYNLLQLTYSQPLANDKPEVLRIHSKADIVVRLPDEPFTEVAGDHFNLLLEHETVGKVLQKWLKTKG